MDCYYLPSWFLLPSYGNDVYHMEMWVGGRGLGFCLLRRGTDETYGASEEVVDTDFFRERCECEERRWLKANSGRGRTYSCSAWASSVWRRNCGEWMASI